MRFLLDTCVVSESILPVPARAVMAWLGAQDEDDLHLCALTLGELGKGIEKLNSMGDRARTVNA